MVVHRLKPAGDEPLEQAEAALERLGSANRGLQAEIMERQSQEDWQAERVLFRAMIEQVQDYLYVKDLQGRFVIVNPAVAADFGCEPEDVVGRTDFDFHPKELAVQFRRDEQKIIDSEEPMIDREEFVITPSGNKKWVSTSKLPLRDDSGRVIGIVGIARDITDRKRAEEQVHFMAHHDVLSGLPNRVRLMDRLTEALRDAKRRGSRVVVIFIDLDNFKDVNDSLGHHAGDCVLRAVAKRMVGCIRATDTVARFGGDEFVILLNDAEKKVTAAVVEKIRARISEPIVVDDHTFHITCSMGVASYPADGTNAEMLLSNADAAMYRAKANGRDRVQTYAIEMTLAAEEKQRLQEGMRTALERDEFTLQFQPQFDIETRQVLAVEALARWNHADFGPIDPSKFIPIAEESGFIVELGDWVLREACRQCKAWHDAGLPPIRICVNVSARQFREKKWVGRVRDALKETGLEPQYLELELTESMLMHDVPQAVATMRALQAVGVQFAIDDFGTGYSSLSALKTFPVARLKLDGSFVRNLPQDDDDIGIATAVLSLGRRLKMDVVAEGVETADQLDFLRDHRCEAAQGFLFSPPLDAGALEEMMRAGGFGGKLTER